MRLRLLRHGTTLAILLALFVVMLGAYTRLTDAGLGCPDWPGCYGRMILPHTPSALMQAQHTYPDVLIEEKKAWTEMAHRYAAGTLAMLIVMLVVLSYVPKLRHRIMSTSYWKMQSSNDASFTTPSPAPTLIKTSLLPGVLLAFIAFQAALGMWTVTLKLLPIVVMGHLLGGITIFATLCYFRWQISASYPRIYPQWRRLVTLGISIVFLQIALGGWVSSNYAGIACIGFPRCNGSWLPTLDWSHAFKLFSSLDLNYQGGVLDNQTRVTIQFVHRLGAVITLFYVLGLTSAMWRFMPKDRLIRKLILFIMLLVLTQFALGIFNVVYLLPLSVAVAHNGIAALLLGAMVSLRYLLSAKGA